MRKIRSSSLPRLALCPGSFAACENLESIGSAASLAGTAGHKALEYYYDQFLSAEPKEVECFIDVELDEMTAGRVRWYAGRIDALIYDHGGAKKILTEIPMSAVLKNGFGEVCLSGHPDLIVVCNDGFTLVIDWKFNFLEVPRASQNIQIMSYVFLLVYGENMMVDVPLSDICAVLSAGGNEDPFTATIYTPELMGKVERHLYSIVTKAVAADARRIPSDDACKYCQARGTARCQESVEELLLLPTLLPTYTLLPPPDVCARMIEIFAYVDRYRDNFKPAMKKAIEEFPEYYADYMTLQNTGSVYTIKDVEKCRKVLVGEGLMTEEEFNAALEVKLTKIAEMAKPELTALGVKVKDQRGHIEELLGAEILDVTPKEKSIKLVKKDPLKQCE